MTLPPTISYKWLWFFSGAAYGLFLRLVVVWLPLNIDGAMSLAFLVATPIAVGAITLFGLRHSVFTLRHMIFYPWVTVILMMLGAAISLLEGSICIALMSPLFLLLSSIGGLLMGCILKFTQRRSQPLAAFALLPFIIALAEPQLPKAPHIIQIQRAVTVNAPADVIWHQIVSAKQIHPDELPMSMSHLIGVPKPVEGVNHMVDGKEIRYSVWEKGVNFQAEVIEKQYPRFIHWRYQFTEHSFPKGSMDDHVAIGGEFFNLLDTTFTLTPVNAQQTTLTLTAHYKIHSAINFYAIPLSTVLGHDFVATILGLYQFRSEREAQQQVSRVSR